MREMGALTNICCLLFSIVYDLLRIKNKITESLFLIVFHPNIYHNYFLILFLSVIYRNYSDLQLFLILQLRHYSQNNTGKYTNIVTVFFAVGRFAVGHFAVGQFAVRTLWRGTVRRKDTLAWDSSP